MFLRAWLVIISLKLFQIHNPAWELIPFEVWNNISALIYLCCCVH
jgi:hypothetical protein